jgi:hypothetical protein
MDTATKLQAEAGAVPLLTAVLCVNCECVTSGRLDQCSVCGSRSLLNLARIIDGASLASRPRRSGAKREIRFDVEIVIDWKQIQPRELSGALESINSLIGPWLARGQASCHIDVAPVPAIGNAAEAEAA